MLLYCKQIKTISIPIFMFLLLFIVSCSEDGTSSSSDNIKADWELLETNIRVDFVNVFFVNENTGWILAIKDIILKTTDGGETWEQHFIPRDYLMITNNRFYEFTFFINEQEGWVAGNPSYLLHTIDGGISWDKVDYDPDKSSDSKVFSPAETMGIHFADEQTGYFCQPSSLPFANEHKSRIYKTTDGGNSWSFTPFLNAQINFITFTDRLTGYASGGEWSSDLGIEIGVIYRTTDGGENWKKLELDSIYQRKFSNVTFIDEKNGIVNLGLGFLRTNDRGESWYYVPYIYRDAFKISGAFKIIMESSKSLIAITNGPGYKDQYDKYYFLVKSLDGGLSWDRIDIQGNIYNEYGNYSFEPKDAYFINENKGYVISDQGRVIRIELK